MRVGMYLGCAVFALGSMPVRAEYSGTVRAAPVTGFSSDVANRAQTPAALFDDRFVHDLWLSVSSADWETLRRDYLLNTYYQADFTWNQYSLRRVGIRSRGSGSRSPEKPNLLVSFSRYDRAQQLLGLNAIVLKANNQDASLLKELITMNLFRYMGLPTPREAPVRLHVNGEFFGAYTALERVDAEFLQRNFGEDDGFLYEWEADRERGYHFEYLGDDPAVYSPRLWSPSNHESNPDTGPIEAMVRAINLSSDEEFVAEVSRYIDLRRFVTFAAVENFTADFDGVLGTVFGMNNFYHYRFKGTTLSEWIAWDRDNSFDWEYKPIFEGVEENVLARRAMRVPELRRVYLETLVKAANFAGGEQGWMARERERLYQLIRDTAWQDLHKQCVAEGKMYDCGGAEFEQAIEHMRQFEKSRAEFVLREAAAAGFREPVDAPVIDAAVNALDSRASVEPGAYISLYGRRLAGSTVAAGDVWPRTLDGVMVFVDGARAPLLYVSPSQINAQIPLDTAAGPVGVSVRVNGGSSNTTVLYVGP